MKKFIAGLLLGLSLSAIPTAAEWDFQDYDLLKQIAGSFLGIVKMQQRIADAEEWQARSLQRLVWVAERKFPPPPEKP